MYATLLALHSLFRWLVLISLLAAIARGAQGWRGKSTFSKRDNALRHWTATIAHVQLAIGMTLYFVSPIVKYFLAHTKEAAPYFEYSFFGWIHFSMMLIAVVLITIGSSLAKRKLADEAKFKTMMLWFSIALLIILLAVPWPFSPLAQRPFFRAF